MRRQIKRFVSHVLGRFNRLLEEHPVLRTRFIGYVRKFPWCEHKLRMIFSEQFRSAQGNSSDSLSHSGVVRELRDGFYVRVVDENQGLDGGQPSQASPLEREFRRYRNIQ